MSHSSSYRGGVEITPKERTGRSFDGRTDQYFIVGF